MYFPSASPNENMKIDSSIKPDAGQPRGTLVIGGDFGEEAHGVAGFCFSSWPGLYRPSTFLCALF